MTNLSRSPSAQRLAAFLHHGDCVWVASPSVALLSAFLAGTGRPKRVVVDENAPAFLSNVGRITGATPVLVAPGEINPTLQRLIKDEGVRPEHVWAVATHRDGELAPAAWLSACLPFGVPTIELCLGSLFALARRAGPIPTFTIVSLDAEATLAGTNLTAVLTSDASLGGRIRQFCLPDPQAADYVLDATPRGLVHDEAGLVSLVEGAIALAEAEKTTGSRKASSSGRSGPPFRPSWNRRFHTEEHAVADSVGEPVPARLFTGENPWLARLAETEERHEKIHEEARRTAAATAAGLQARIAEVRSAHDELLSRHNKDQQQATEQTERTAVILAETEDRLDELVKGKAELERTASSLESAHQALASKLAEVESDRDQALAEAARHEGTLQSALQEQTRRTAQLEQETAALTEREAKLVETWETSRAELSAHVARLEEEVRHADGAHVALLAQKADLERDLKLTQVESEARATKIVGVESDRDLALAEAARREVTLQSALEEQKRHTAQFEQEAAALTEREAKLVETWEASRAEFSAHRARLEGAVRHADGGRDQLLTQKAHLERDLKSTQVESEARAIKLVGVERDRDLALAEATQREQTLRSTLEEQTRRTIQLEQETAALSEHEAELLEGWETSRTELSAHITQLEGEVRHAHEAGAGLLTRKDDLERDLKSTQAESEARAVKLAAVERDRDLALAGATRREETLRSALEEQTRHTTELKLETAALTEREEELLEGRETLRTELSAHRASLEGQTRHADGVRDQFLTQKADLERDLKSIRAESEARAIKLAAAESDRDRALAEASRKEEALQSARKEQEQRTAQLEHEAATLAEREAKRLESWEASRTELSAHVARLEAEARHADEAHTELLTRKADAERELELIMTQKEDLAKDLTQVEEALQAARASIEEVRSSAETEMTRAAENWRAKLESAEQARRALETALAARGSEASTYEKSHEMWRAHRTTLEERVEQLKQELEAATQPAPPLDISVEAATAEPVETESMPITNREREPAPWEAQPPRFATSLNGSEASLFTEGELDELHVPDFVDYAGPSETLLRSGTNPHAEARFDQPTPAFTPEYEEKGPQAEEAGSANSRAWLRSVADRIRRG